MRKILTIYKIICHNTDRVKGFLYCYVRAHCSTIGIVPVRESVGRKCISVNVWSTLSNLPGPEVKKDNGSAVVVRIETIFQRGSLLVHTRRQRRVTRTSGPCLVAVEICPNCLA